MSVKDILTSKDVVSLEERREDILTLNNISYESLGSFFREFGARSKDLTLAILPSTAERAYKDSIRHASLVKTKMRDFDNTDLAAIAIVVPENFSGNMVTLIDDIIVGYDSIVESSKELFFSITRDIAENINTSNMGVVNPPTSFMKAKEIRFKRETFQKNLANMFKYNKARSYSKVIEHFRSTDEVIEMYSRLGTLERTLGKGSVDELIKLSVTLTKEINTYMGLIKGSKLDRKSERAFKELTEAVYEAAKDLEFIGYLQGISLQLYRSVGSLGERVSAYKK